MDSRIKSEFGSIGIGAMIVFIALILVAAVASTVIINTIQDTSENAESTVLDVRGELSKKVLVEGAYISERDCTVVIWEHGGAAGWSASFTVGAHTGAAFVVAGGTDNAASTVVVDDGCRAILYENSDFSGWENTYEVGSHAINPNDQLSSLIVQNPSSRLPQGFELEMIMELGLGSPPIPAETIRWSVSCKNGTGVGLDSEDIVTSRSRLLGDTNTLGDDSDFVAGEIIEYGMVFKVPVSFSNCIPDSGINLPLLLHVDGGATTNVNLALRATDQGTNLFFDP